MYASKHACMDARMHACAQRTEDDTSIVSLDRKETALDKRHSLVSPFSSKSWTLCELRYFVCGVNEKKMKKQSSAVLLDIFVGFGQNILLPRTNLSVRNMRHLYLPRGLCFIISFFSYYAGGISPISLCNDRSNYATR